MSFYLPIIAQYEFVFSMLLNVKEIISKRKYAKTSLIKLREPLRIWSHHQSDHILKGSLSLMRLVTKTKVFTIERWWDKFFFFLPTADVSLHTVWRLLLSVCRMTSTTSHYEHYESPFNDFTWETQTSSKHQETQRAVWRVWSHWWCDHTLQTYSHGSQFDESYHLASQTRVTSSLSLISCITIKVLLRHVTTFSLWDFLRVNVVVDVLWPSFTSATSATDDDDTARDAA